MFQTVSNLILKIKLSLNRIGHLNRHCLELYIQVPDTSSRVIIYLGTRQEHESVYINVQVLFQTCALQCINIQRKILIILQLPNSFCRIEHFYYLCIKITLILTMALVSAKQKLNILVCLLCCVSVSITKTIM